MSRIRSQLDTILAGNQAQNNGSPAPAAPRRAYAPHQSDGYSAAPQQYVPQPTAPRHAQQPPAAPNRDFANLQRTLDQLADRISSLPKQAPANPAHQAPDFAKANSALIHEIRNGYQQLRQDFTSVQPATDPALSADLKRIADGIAKLQNSQFVHPDYIEQMQAELGNLNTGLGHLINTPQTQIDLSGVSRSIETGYSDIVNKLDQVLSSRGNELPGFDMPDYSGQFASLNERLEEVTRAVVSLSVAPSTAQDQQSFERVEARLASLAKSVDAIIENGSSAPAAYAANPDSMTVSFGESIAAQLAQLSEKLDNAGTMNEVGSHIFADVQGIASRLDNLQNEFGILCSSLDRSNAENHSVEAVDYSNHFGEIENHLSALANRMDAMMDQPGASPNTDGQEILSVLKDLVGRIEGIEQVAYQSNEESDGSDQFAALESQLSGISAQLGSLGNLGSVGGGTAPDFSSITERLDHIEGQIASSRDIVIDIASEAAERAAQSVSGGAGNDTAFAGILDELRQLREGQGVVAQGAVAESGLADHQFSAISDTMAMIADRLANLENGNFAAYEQSAQHSDESQFAAAPVMDIGQPTEYQPTEYASQETYQDADTPEVAVQETSTYEASAYGQAPTEAYVAVDEQVRTNEAGEDFQHIEEAPSLDMHFSNEQEDQFENSDDFVKPEPQAELPEGEDVPLEPGSGMPDLEALVRNATQRKKNKSNAEAAASDDESSSTSELMAAARRAARMASQEAKAIAEKPVKKTIKRPSLPSIKAPAFVNKKVLMMSAAVAAIAIGGFMVVPKFLGGSNNVPVAEAPASVEPAVTTEETASAADIENQDQLATGSAGKESSDGVRKVDSEGTSENTSAMLSSTPVAEQTSQTLQPAEEAPVKAPLPAENSVIETPPSEVGNATLLAAVTAGDGNAIFEVARRYTDGDGVERDLSEAIKWYRIAAENGHAPSQYRIGNFYEKGHGIAADPVEASNWYSKAAAQGNALAMHNLAVLNTMGAATGEVDMTTAIGWFEKAANMGVKDSQVNLGILYTKGMGVDEDLEQAYKWFAVAAKGGDNDAGKKRDTVAQAMRPEQLEKARGEAEIWKPAKIDADANVAKVQDAWKSGGSPKAATLSKSEIIKRTQIMLANTGFDPGAPDGQMGSKTRKAIESFQSKMGLATDGQISENLLKALSKTSI